MQSVFLIQIVNLSPQQFFLGIIFVVQQHDMCKYDVERGCYLGDSATVNRNESMVKNRVVPFISSCVVHLDDEWDMDAKCCKWLQPGAVLVSFPGIW